MTSMEWAKFAADYLKSARSEIHDDFNLEMREITEYSNFHREQWYRSCKDIIQNLYHYSGEFVQDAKIPGSRFSSPDNFKHQLDEFENFVEDMRSEIDSVRNQFNYTRCESIPHPVFFVQRRVYYIKEIIAYVKNEQNFDKNYPKELSDSSILTTIANRFHEAVVAMRWHKRSNLSVDIQSEYDCQCLFHSILAAIFKDVRNEEPTKVVAGSFSKCEFFIPEKSALIELKFVRKSSDQKRIKNEIAADIIDYSSREDVTFIIFLVYDPSQNLMTPAALCKDLSKKTDKADFKVIVTPPR